MKKLHIVLALAVLSASIMGGSALAQDHHDNRTYVEHKEWKKGAPVRHEDWDRGDKVDYHENHLAAPPRGYEWRMVDGPLRSRQQLANPDSLRRSHTVAPSLTSIEPPDKFEPATWRFCLYFSTSFCKWEVLDLEFPNRIEQDREPSDWQSRTGVTCRAHRIRRW
jgi:Ni/Co efflux regulator RcnB